MKSIYLYFIFSMSFIRFVTISTSVMAESFFTNDVSNRDKNTFVPQVSIHDSSRQIQVDSTLSPIDSITSVSELSNVETTDWAFEALQSLSKRYQCTNIDYSRNTNGTRSLTRYEFSFWLNSCLNEIEERMASLSSEDLTIIRKLQNDFATQLSIIQDRVEKSEARITKLETNQFSTTTKLVGQVVWGLSGGGFTGDRIVDGTGREITDEQPNVTTSYRATLDFDSSFKGTDLLKVRVEAGSDRISDNTGGFLEPQFGSVLDFSYRSAVDDKFSITRLDYTFSLSENLTLNIAPALDVVFVIDKNNYANPSSLNFSTYAFTANYLLFPLTPGASASIDWNLKNSPFSFRALYLASDASNPQLEEQERLIPASPLGRFLYPQGGGKRGLFGSPNQGFFEIEYASNDNFVGRFQYSRGKVFEDSFEVFGANLELAFNDRFAVFGRYSYASYDDTAFGDIDPNYWMAGLNIQDLFVSGSIAGFAIGQPFIADEVGDATQTNIEAFYAYPISDDLKITPLVQIITNPGNQSANETIFTGNLRTVFSF